jgi:hypothetical protein
MLTNPTISPRTRKRGGHGAASIDSGPARARPMIIAWACGVHWVAVPKALRARRVNRWWQTAAPRLCR